ncbi:hypothetical protein Pan181_53660 [Aeoliella mucimassa]|uniref:Uncharacterized protein n=1 Tax=Aeoliella mucimassa TaxID=2527972 RepID=A0A518AWL5_9BACT|nr:hypothetical protein Pan181_53660 [Aeoliella mucimassa]
MLRVCPSPDDAYNGLTAMSDTRRVLCQDWYGLLRGTIGNAFTLPAVSTPACYRASPRDFYE